MAWREAIFKYFIISLNIENQMDRLQTIALKEDIPARYRDTPIGHLLEYHNLGRKLDPYTNAELLIGMCMDNRKHLHIPDNFAFIIRTGGANLTVQRI